MKLYDISIFEIIIYMNSEQIASLEQRIKRLESLVNDKKKTTHTDTLQNRVKNLLISQQQINQDHQQENANQISSTPIILVQRLEQLYSNIKSKSLLKTQQKGELILLKKKTL